MIHTGRTSYVDYATFDNSGHRIFGDVCASCYASLTYSEVNSKTSKIEAYCDFETICYKDDDVEKWVALINMIGFPLAYEKRNNKHVFIISLDGQDREFYRHRLALNSVLTLVRYLWHERLEMIPFHCFKILEEVEDADPFYALQAAHLYIHQYANTNHSVRDSSCRKFISHDALFKKIKESGDIFSQRNHYGYLVTESWTGDIVRNVANKSNYKETYKTLLKNSNL